MSKRPMDKYVIKLNKTSLPTSNNVLDNAREDIASKRPRIQKEFLEDDIIGDPGLRTPINSSPANIKDEIRRRYLAKVHMNHVIINSHKTIFSGSGMRRFKEEWFKTYYWLEYSMQKDVACCLWYYLFNSNKSGGDDAFIRVGFRNWRKATAKLKKHEEDLSGAHHYARNQVSAYKNQRQSVDYVSSQKKKKAMEKDYRVRLMVIVDVVRYLLE